MRKENSKGTNDIVSDLETIRSLADHCISRIRQEPKTFSGKGSSDSRPDARGAKLDFDSNIRAFVKKHARRFSGPQKFALLVAYVSKGIVGSEVPLNVIEQHWNKMTSSSLLGGRFNRFYSNSAKENGWVNSPKKGFYVLRPSWADIFKEN
jgi:hypothetical protein